MFSLIDSDLYLFLFWIASSDDLVIKGTHGIKNAN